MGTVLAVVVGYCGGRVTEAVAIYAINKFCCNDKESIVNSASNQNATYSEVSQNDDVEGQVNNNQSSNVQPNSSLNYRDGLQKLGRGCWSQFTSFFGY